MNEFCYEMLQIYGLMDLWDKGLDFDITGDLKFPSSQALYKQFL